MFHGHLDDSQKPPFGDRLNTKLGDHGTPNHYIIQIHHVVMWDYQYSEIFSHIQTKCGKHPRIFHRIMLVPRNTILDMDNVTTLIIC